MDLRQLRSFVAAVEAGGLRRASRKLYVSQPSITTAIQSLEAELGVQLLSRTPHGILVTEHGRELLRHAAEILTQAERAKAAVRRVGSQPRAAMRIALSSGIITAGELTMPILERFREQHPNMRLEVPITELRFADTSAVLSGLVDAAIVRGPLVAFEAPRSRSFRSSRNRGSCSSGPLTSSPELTPSVSTTSWTSRHWGSWRPSRGARSGSWTTTAAGATSTPGCRR